MKKKLTVILSVMMLSVMSLTVFASDSATAPAPTEPESKTEATQAPTESESKTEATQAPTESEDGSETDTTVADGSSPTTPDPTTAASEDDEETEDVKVEKAEGATDVKASDVAVAGSVKAAIESLGIDTKTVAKVIELTGNVTAGGVAEVTVTVDGIKKGEPLYGIHIKKDGTVEIVPVEAIDDNTILIRTSSFSPFIIVKGVAPEVSIQQTVPATQTSDQNASDGATSPKTGQRLPIALFAVIVCLAGATFCTRKLMAHK